VIVAKKTADRDRKVRLEEMRRAQQAKERRRTLLVVGAAVVVVLLLVAVVVAVIRNYQAERDLASVGVTTAAASCDPVTSDATSGSSVHVGPGTDKPNVTKIKYATVPPSSGQHFVTPESQARAFYTAKDRPKMETLVHNLEHGYTVLWYLPSVPAAQQAELKKISDLARTEDSTKGKFIVSAWDEAYGDFPSGKTVALSHWGTSKGHRQLCGGVSGDVVKSFVAKYPYSDSPEPNGA
jgi:fermentation-respiration switch protein FrsA (DUF1100 family)